DRPGQSGWPATVPGRCACLRKELTFVTGLHLRVPAASDHIGIWRRAVPGRNSCGRPAGPHIPPGKGVHVSRLPLIEPGTADKVTEELFAPARRQIGGNSDMIRAMANGPAVFNGYLALSAALSGGRL